MHRQDRRTQPTVIRSSRRQPSTERQRCLSSGLEIDDGCIHGVIIIERVFDYQQVCGETRTEIGNASIGGESVSETGTNSTQKPN
jgi:hypothetical protein